MSIDALNKASTYGEVLNRASFFLEVNGIDPHIAEWLMKERFSFTLTALLINQRKLMPEAQKEHFKNDILEAAKGKPAQHIVGHEWFYDRKFKVTQDTLIPRPETEEWFDHYIKNLPNPSLNILDIGTGSGVLAVSHKVERPQDTVTAVDISEKALTIAQKNAQSHHADIQFLLSDMTSNVEGTFDVIVSNPPYISKDETKEMDASVLNYEPKTALFAEENGLYFYKQLAKELPAHLNTGGCILLEIGYKQGEAVTDLFRNAFPDAQITCWKDMNGQDRTVCIQTT